MVYLDVDMVEGGVALIAPKMRGVAAKKLCELERPPLAADPEFGGRGAAVGHLR